MGFRPFAQTLPDASRTTRLERQPRCDSLILLISWRLDLKWWLLNGISFLTFSGKMLGSSWYLQYLQHVGLGFQWIPQLVARHNKLVPKVRMGQFSQTWILQEDQQKPTSNRRSQWVSWGAFFLTLFSGFVVCNFDMLWSEFEEKSGNLEPCWRALLSNLSCKILGRPKSFPKLQLSSDTWWYMIDEMHDLWFNKKGITSSLYSGASIHHEVDPETPSSVCVSQLDSAGRPLTLVFSDEFNVPGYDGSTMGRPSRVVSGCLVQKLFHSDMLKSPRKCPRSFGMWFCPRSWWINRTVWHEYHCMESRKLERTLRKMEKASMNFNNREHHEKRLLKNRSNKTTWNPKKTSIPTYLSPKKSSSLSKIVCAIQPPCWIC